MYFKKMLKSPKMTKLVQMQFLAKLKKVDYWVGSWHFQDGCRTLPKPTWGNLQKGSRDPALYNQQC